MRRQACIALAVLAGLAPACTADGSGAPREARVESRAETPVETAADPIAGRRAVRNPGSRAAAPDTVRARIEVTIGEVEGEAVYLFGEIGGLAADRRGRIYVVDALKEAVFVYGPDGRFLTRIGRSGDGPGEFRGPTTATFDRQGRLYVRDYNRITVFAAPTPGGIADSVVATWPGPAYGGPGQFASGIDRAGRYYFSHYLFAHGQPARYFYLIFQDGKMLGDTLRVPPYPNLEAQRSAWYRTGARGGRMVEGLAHVPFAAVPAWDVTDRGTLLSGDGATYVLFETTVTGDTVGRISRPAPPVPVPAAEARDSAAALEARLDALPVPASQLRNASEEVKAVRLPDVLPAFLSVRVAVDGRVWVERWPAEGHGGSTYFDVFDPGGRYLGVVVVPAPLLRTPSSFFAADAIYGVVRDPETDVQRVVRAAFDAPPWNPNGKDSSG